MTQDIVADVLNIIMNAKKAGKKEVEIERSSKLLKAVLVVMKKNKYLASEEKDGKIKIKFEKLNKCKAIKPRYDVNKKTIEKYIRRFLPSREYGILIVSTSKGLITHKEAEEKGIGGALIAFCY